MGTSRFPHTPSTGPLRGQGASRLVRPLAHLSGGAGVTVVELDSVLNDEQLAAVEADGSVFVSAGAGTGKTSVLVERYVRAVCDRGIDVESILVITYTRKAAGELRTRIRAALRERGRPDLARELDGAWISTIHGFCLRLLKSHPFEAGLDPRFRILDDSQGRVVRGEAFAAALTEFCAGEEPERLQLLALTQVFVVAQQVARLQLVILEVERRLRVLRLRVRGVECRQELLEQLAVA